MIQITPAFLGKGALICFSSNDSILTDLYRNGENCTHANTLEINVFLYLVSTKTLKKKNQKELDLFSGTYSMAKIWKLTLLPTKGINPNYSVKI